MLQIALVGSGPPSLTDVEVAVLRGTEEFNYALQKQAIPIAFDNINDALKAIELRQVRLGKNECLCRIKPKSCK